MKEINFYIKEYVKTGHIVKKFLWFVMVQYNLSGTNILGQSYNDNKVVWVPSWHIIGDK